MIIITPVMLVSSAPRHEPQQQVLVQRSFSAYGVLFSYALFNEGWSGLTITIGAIVTHKK
jgi:hypothetical protein